MYYFYVEVLFYYKEASKKLFWATLTSSILNIILSYWLIPVLGVRGSILADAVSMLVRVFIIVFISRKYENIGLRIKDFVLSFIAIEIFIVVGLLLSYLRYSSIFSFYNFIYKCFVVIFYIVFMALFNKKQVSVVKRYIKTKFFNRGGIS